MPEIIADICTPDRSALVAYVLGDIPGSPALRAAAADQLEDLALDVARELMRVVVHGDVGDEFDALYVDFGGEG